MASPLTPLQRYAHDPVAFTDDLITRNELGQPFRLFPEQRELDHAAFVFDAEGRLPWDTFVDSQLKKSAKTFNNARRLLWWGYTQEAPNEIFILANDQEQSQSRVFSTAARLIRNNPALAQSVVSIDSRRIVLTNGTTIVALASEYAGAAGSNHGLTSWDELWAYTSEAARRLWEELTPVPTRRNSVRFVTTYAGWEDESTLLLELYKLGVGPEEHPEGRGERVHPTLPLYMNRDARLLVYWDHTPRMPWLTESYYAAQRKALRPATFDRLHRNRWGTSESRLITPELWDPCVEPTWSPLDPQPGVSIYVGLDAAPKGDTSGMVGVFRDGNQVILARHCIWRPSPGEPLDFEATIEATLREWHAQYSLASVLVDPYQMHATITRLQREGLPVVEFPQTSANLTRAGQALYELLRSQSLVLYPSAELREQALNTVAIDGARGFRIAKEKASRKIDAIAALSFACVAALDAPVLDPVRVW